MKLKFKLTIISAVAFMMLTGFNSYAQEYVVKLNDYVQLYSESDSPADRFITVDESELQDYIDAGVVEYYEPNAEVQLIEGNYSNSTQSSLLSETSEESSEDTQLWNHKNINAQFSVNVGALGNRVRIGVIDSGINMYSDLEGRVLDGWDFYEESADVTDVSGHGTFVSSIIASPVYGFAYESYIVPLKCFYKSGTDANGEDVFTANSNDIKDAIFAAVDKYHCDVINMSFEFGTDAESKKHVKEAIDYAEKNGVIIIAAVGNYNTSDMYYPAAYDNVIGVGNVNVNNERSVYSQYNKSVFVVAPGEDVTTTDGTYQYLVSGTSMSAPHVSALAAVAKCIKPSITNSEFMTLISETAENLGDDEGYDEQFGYGIINCEQAVKALIKDRKIYISPVVMDNGYSGVWIYNNTSDNLPFRLLYTTSAQVDSPIKTTQISEFSAGQVGFMNLPYTGGNIKYMAWDSFTNLVPLAVASEYIAE